MRTLNCRWWIGLVVVLILAFSLDLALADATNGSSGSKSDPAVASGWKLDAGYQQGLDAANSDQIYYHLEYQGHLVREGGTALTDADSIGSATKAGLSKADPNLLALTVERGQGTPSGSLFDALGLSKAFNLSGLREMRGAFRLSGSLNGDDLTFAAGLETPPLHPLGITGSTPNWLILGLVGQAQDGDQKSSKDALSATWRSFIGRSGGWVHSDRSRFLKAAQEAGPTYLDSLAWLDAQERHLRTDPWQVRKVVQGGAQRVNEGAFEAAKGWQDWVKGKLTAPGDDAEGFLKEYPHLSDAVAAYKAQGTRTPKLPDQLKTVVEALNPSGVPVPDADWQRTLTQVFRLSNASPDQPTWALWLEGTGWYIASGDEVDGRRFNNLFAATATWWLHPEDGDKQWIRLRYEVGRSRSDAEDYRNRLMLSVGLAF